MKQVREYFDFSTGQLRIIALLSVLALGLSGYLLVRSFAVTVPESSPLMVHVGEKSPGYTALFVVDPNSSPVDSLELLPGIGRVLADRIVEFRQHHRFASDSEITLVKGIGPKMYERLKPYLKVRQP